MASNRTFEELTNALISDFNWRLREISDIRLTVRQATPTTRPTLLRSLVPMLYAHWEGYVAFSSDCYVNYICARKHRYKDLQQHFLVNALMGHFNRISSRSLNLRERVDFVETMLHAREDQMKQLDGRLFSTRSNLTFSTLKDLCAMLCLDASLFDAY